MTLSQSDRSRASIQIIGNISLWKDLQAVCGSDGHETQTGDGDKMTRNLSRDHMCRHKKTWLWTGGERTIFVVTKESLKSCWKSPHRARVIQTFTKGSKDENCPSAGPSAGHSRESSLVKTLKHAATTSSCNSLSLFRSTSCAITCPRFAPIPCPPPALFPNGH